jgi:hypothetical protein
VANCAEEGACTTPGEEQCAVCEHGYYLVDGAARQDDTCTACTPIAQCESVVCTDATDSECVACEEASLDRFNCYDATIPKNPPFPVQAGISLVDLFGSSTANADKIGPFCAAASLDASAVEDEDASLCCYNREPALSLPPGTPIQTTDFLGTLELEVKRANLLCQTCNAAGSEPACAADDHFQCYEVTVPKKARRFTTKAVAADDAFQTATVNVTRPALFCAASSQDGSETNESSLCCYSTSAANLAAPLVVPIEDEFGELSLTIKKSDMVCAPCSATVLF